MFTLHHNGHLHHIGIGHRHTGILVRVHDRHTTRVLITDGELLAELHLDPSKDNQLRLLE